eukprot:3544193-Rhodomonas_salina.1
MTVTRRAWIAHRFASSKRCTRYASAASCSASKASACHRSPDTLYICVSSLTKRANGSFRSRSSVVFWYRRISISARVPGRYRWFFFAAPAPPAAPPPANRALRERHLL